MSKPVPAPASVTAPAPAPSLVPVPVPTYCGPPQLWNTLLTFDMFLEKHWRLIDFSFLRWWLHAWVLLPRTLPKFSTLGPPVPGLAGAVVQTLLSLLNYLFIKLVIHYENIIKTPSIQNCKRQGADIFKKRFTSLNLSCVTCQVLHATCHMAHVLYHTFLL